jgi:hypothetical protein
MPPGTSSGICKEMRLRQRASYLEVQAGGMKLHGRHVLALAKRRADGGDRGRLGLINCPSPMAKMHISVSPRMTSTPMVVIARGAVFAAWARHEGTHCVHSGTKQVQFDNERYRNIPIHHHS